MVEQLQDGRVLASYQGQQGTFNIFENKLFRWLCVDEEQAIQSCMCIAEPAELILPYQQFMMMWQLLCTEKIPHSTCLIGIGGGDIIRYLQKAFPKMEITAVDNEPQIVKIASEYFLIKPEQKKLTLQIESAEQYIKKSHQHELLLIDVVANSVLPSFLSEIDFWKNCHAILNEHGIMVVNVIPESEEHFLNILEVLRSVFGHIPLCVEVPEHKNVVLLVTRSIDMLPSLSVLKQRSAEQQKTSALPFMQWVEILEKNNILAD